LSATLAIVLFSSLLIDHFYTKAQTASYPVILRPTPNIYENINVPPDSEFRYVGGFNGQVSFNIFRSGIPSLINGYPLITSGDQYTAGTVGTTLGDGTYNTYGHGVTQVGTNGGRLCSQNGGQYVCQSCNTTMPGLFIDSACRCGGTMNYVCPNTICPFDPETFTYYANELVLSSGNNAAAEAADEVTAVNQALDKLRTFNLPGGGTVQLNMKTGFDVCVPIRISRGVNATFTYSITSLTSIISGGLPNHAVGVKFEF